MKSESKFPKFLLFILSMAPFFVILGLMCMDIPISFDKDSKFIGWESFWHNTWFGLAIITVSCCLELILLCLFNKICNDEAGEQSEVIVKVANKNYELVSFVTSIFLPIISFQYNQLSHWIVTLIIIIIIGYIFCTSDHYFTNPTLAIFHYRLYEVELDVQDGKGTKRELIVLSKTKLSINDIVRCNKLTDKVSYVKKV